MKDGIYSTLLSGAETISLVGGQLYVCIKFVTLYEYR